MLNTDRADLRGGGGGRIFPEVPQGVTHSVPVEHLE